MVLVARRRERLEQIAGELRALHGVEVEVLAADLTDPDQLRAVERRLELQEKPIDLLVNNAGGGKPGPGALFAHDRDGVEGQAILNAVAVLRLTHAALGAMTRVKRGNVIQVSAGVAFYPIPWGATYAASKAFVNSLSQAANFELRGTGVHVTVTCPGFTRTEAPARNGFSEDNVPRCLWSEPEDVVRTALAAAAAGKAIVSPSLPDRIGASFGGHFPRVMLRLAARLTS